jgi:hypothetical protein
LIGPDLGLKKLQRWLSCPLEMVLMVDGWLATAEYVCAAKKGTPP